jgi:hypothetical protein
MADEFELFLAAQLSPDEGTADRRFVARVQAAIALDEQFAAQRRSLIAGLGLQGLALVTVAAGVLWISRAPPVGQWFIESPEFALPVLLTGFVIFGVMLARGNVGRDSFRLNMQPIQ